MFAKLRAHSETFEEKLRGVEKQIDTKTTALFSILSNDVDPEAAVRMENIIQELIDIKKDLTHRVNAYRELIVHTEDKNENATKTLNEASRKVNRIKSHLAEFGLSSGDGDTSKRVGEDNGNITFNEISLTEANDTFNLLSS